MCKPYETEYLCTAFTSINSYQILILIAIVTITNRFEQSPFEQSYTLDSSYELAFIGALKLVSTIHIYID